ncbi:hypothetical protein ACWC5I_32155 [Kitasatospora sp. NPDC001574]
MTGAVQVWLSHPGPGGAGIREPYRQRFRHPHHHPYRTIHAPER